MVNDYLDARTCRADYRRRDFLFPLCNVNRFESRIMTTVTIRQLDSTRQAGFAGLDASSRAPVGAFANRVDVVGVASSEFVPWRMQDSQPGHVIGAATGTGGLTR
jgi:hypothetical protein